MSDELQPDEWAAMVVGASPATAIDSAPEHLYPEFRKRLIDLMEKLDVETGEGWVIAEGYRSQARQSYLYAQGRTRPGPIVTWLKTPTWHGTGLAADIRPKRGYNVPARVWRIKHELEPQFGLSNPPYVKGDLGHVQIADGAQWRAKAAAWVKAGFSDPEPERIPVRIYVGPSAVLGAEGYMLHGRAWALARPVMLALHADFDIPQGGQMKARIRGVERFIEARVENGRAFIPLGGLMAWPAVMVKWDPLSRWVRITVGG